MMRKIINNNGEQDDYNQTFCALSTGRKYSRSDWKEDGFSHYNSRTVKVRWLLSMAPYFLRPAKEGKSGVHVGGKEFTSARKRLHNNLPATSHAPWVYKGGWKHHLCSHHLGHGHWLNSRRFKLHLQVSISTDPPLNTPEVRANIWNLIGYLEETKTPLN